MAAQEHTAVNPYASPRSDTSPQEPLRDSRIVQVRWTRPSFSTFANLSLLWGFCTGIPVGIVGVVASLVGDKTDVLVVIWHFQGIAGGLVGIVLAPVVFTILGAYPLLLFPLLRLGTAASKGLRLCFHTDSNQNLHFSRLQLRSYIKLSAVLGFLSALFSVMIPLVICATSKVDGIRAAGVPLLFDGAARLIWIVLVTPLLYTIYAAAIGIPAFLPFRVLTRMLSGAAIPSEEVLTGD